MAPARPGGTVTSPCVKPAAAGWLIAAAKGWPPRGFCILPRVVVDQVVSVNRGVRAVWPLEAGSTGTFA